MLTRSTASTGLLGAVCAVAWSLAVAVPALAQGTTLESAQPILGAGPGTVRLEAATAAGAETGTAPCASESAPDGYPHVAIYRVATQVRALLQVSLADDLDGALSLCSVALYAARDASGAFTDPYSATERERFAIAATDGCASGARCALQTWLDRGSTVFLAAWSAPPAFTETATDASFAFTARLRVPIRPSMAIVRAIAGGASPVFEAGRSRVEARAPGAGGVVVFVFTDVLHRDAAVSVTRSLSEGIARIGSGPSRPGPWTVRLRYRGDDAHLPAATAPVRIVVAEPAGVPFALYRDVTLTLPDPAAATVTYHESLFASAMGARPFGRLLRNDNRRFRAPSRTPGPGYIVMGSRGRRPHPASASDIVIDRRAPFLSPVTGTVVSIRSYLLYCRHRDVRVVIRPAADPRLTVVVFHLRDVTVRAGQRVDGARTRLGYARAFPFASQTDRYVAGGKPHVHVEVERDGSSPLPGC